MTESLEEAFAKRASELTENITSESERWAAWLHIAHNEILPLADTLCLEEHKSKHWNEPQKNLFEYLIKTEDPNFFEMAALIKEIGNVDEIWDACWHIAYMYGMTFVSEEAIDKVLKDVETCPRCSDTYALMAYQMPIWDTPLTPPECFALAHTPSETLIWSYVSQVESQLEMFVKLHKEYKVEYKAEAA